MTEQTGANNIIVENAGMVILHPFLPSYFNILQFTNEGQFISDEAAIRGAHLLEYLATGEEFSESKNLSLNGMLCNINLQSSKSSPSKITEEEKAISEELLNAVINHWQALGKTSIEGLRDSFLKRSAELVYEKEKNKLHVEERAYDILLDKLPWNIFMIQFPWMEKMLEVHWR